MISKGTLMTPSEQYRAVMELLKQRHAKDLFVPECKDGQSWGRSHNRVDAWAMRRSYSKFQLSGYEIKLNRADFLRDEKYPNYLPMCNVLYFVSPHGLIDPTELPEEVGLLLVTKNASRTYVKKKAPIRKIDPPVALYEYLLMSRATIKEEVEYKVDERQRRIQRFRDYIEEKISLQDLGHHVSMKVASEVREMQREVFQSKNVVATYKDMRERLIEMGLDPDRSIAHFHIDRALENAGVMDGKAALKKIQQAIDLLMAIPPGLVNKEDA